MTADMTVTYLLAYLLACGSNKSLNTIKGENENENEKNLFPTKTTEHYSETRESVSREGSQHKLHTYDLSYGTLEEEQREEGEASSSKSNTWTCMHA